MIRARGAAEERDLSHWFRVRRISTGAQFIARAAKSFEGAV